MTNKYKEDFIQMKQQRREKKRTIKRDIIAEEVIFIFEKVLEGWKTIKIYNTIIQNNPNSCIDKKKQKLFLQVIVKYMNQSFQRKDSNIILNLEKRFMN